MTRKRAETESLVEKALSFGASALLPQARRELPIPDGLRGLFPICETLGVLEHNVQRLLAPHGIEVDALFRFAQAVREIDANDPARADETLTGMVRRDSLGNRRVDPPLHGYEQV